MEHIKEALYLLSAVSVISGMAEIFCSNGKLRKYASYIVALIVITVLTIPICSFLGSFDLSSFDINLQLPQESYTDEQLKQTIESAIQRNIESTLGIPYAYLRTEIVFSDSDSETVIESISVKILNRKYFSYAERVDAYLKSIFGCEIKVIQNIEE